MAPKRNTAPTMKDVAAEAGVALGTVSKVYNNLPVRDEYREKVLAAAHKLGYSVNHYARGFKTNRTNTVALIWPTLRNPFFAYLSDAMIGELTRRDYRAIVSITNYDGQAEQFVSIDRHFRTGVPCVASDNFGGGQLAAQKLLELGCQKLLFLRLGSAIAGEPDKRQAGFEATCRERSVPFDSLSVQNEEGFTPFDTFLDAHLHSGVFDYDGIFCNTDRLCYEIEKRLRARGVLVPTHVQMIGFDGIYRFDSEDLSCSTIVQPAEQIARAAVDLLLAQDRVNLPALVCLPVTYRAGGTTKDSAGENKPAES